MGKNYYYYYYHSGKIYHNLVIKQTTRTTIIDCYLQMQVDSSSLFEENHAP